ncbi:MAG: hypothetical protein ACE5GW_10085, partial [Planctomycetota bacterium]
DGPRGPRRHVQPGIIDLARRTGLAILPAALAYRHCRRLRSWDRMAIPHPFTPAVVLFGEPLLVAAEAGPGGGGEEEPRGLLESRLCSLSERAEADFGLLYAAGEASLEGFDPTPRLRSAPGPRNR